MRRALLPALAIGLLAMAPAAVAARAAYPANAGQALLAQALLKSIRAGGRTLPTRVIRVPAPPRRTAGLG